MSGHHVYLIILGALFVVVFAIMIHSLARHRHATGGAAARFSGPTGTVQWLWAMVPIVILIGIDFALIASPSRPSGPQTIALAATPPAAASVGNAVRGPTIAEQPRR